MRYEIMDAIRQQKKSAFGTIHVTHVADLRGFSTAIDHWAAVQSVANPCSNSTLDLMPRHNQTADQIWTRRVRRERNKAADRAALSLNAGRR
jgi:hypothetical protein